MSPTPWPSRLDLPASERLDFISDVHLHPGAGATYQVWQTYIHGCSANALFILGDLFESWVGDDILQAKEQHPELAAFALKVCADLRQLAQRIPVFVQHGNRDFLLGPAFAQAAQVQILLDPCLLRWGDRRILLSHGDALCLDDKPYMQARQQVRTSQWQENIMHQPLAQRIALAAQLRTNAAHNPDYARIDLDKQAMLDWLQQYGATDLVHGHTHRPQSQALTADFHRHVLSDWDYDHAQRAQVLQLYDKQGFVRIDM